MIQRKPPSIMRPDRWRKVEELYHAASEREPNQRAAFLREACQGDDELKSEVESLLAQEPSPAGLLGWAAPPGLSAALAPGLSPRDELGLYRIIEPARTGQILSHYRVLDKLGAGGMGVVYKAQDLKLDRLVALKFMPPHLSSDPQHEQRFIQEAKAASALEHANIGVVHDIDKTPDGQMFIVMAYYDGETLARRIERGVSTQEAIDISIQILKALQAAHERSIVHRDVKPGNVLLTPEGVVKVIDFGLARMADLTVTLEGMPRGTIAYMSPEQVRGEQVDSRSDIWASGVVLYEMLVGRRPFGGDKSTMVIRSILEAEPKDLKTRRDLPIELTRVVRRALAKDPKARYSSADEMEKDLEVLRASQAPRRWPRFTIAAAAALLLFLGLGVWFVAQERRLQWVRDEAIPQIERLIAEDNYLAAFDLAKEAERRSSTDTRLAALWPEMSRTISIDTDPPGAQVSFKKYAAPESEWRHLGIGPIAKTRVPLGVFEWKVSKEGYEEFHGAGPTPVSNAVKFQLSLKASVPAGMVKVPRGTFTASISSFGVIGPVMIDDYYIDRYEVTNREFKQFVNRRGYQSRQYWKEIFRKDGRELSWEQAMREFVDATGRPGPANWEAGSYREGEEDLPVSGVSWYEAAAYAEFVGKSLPTVAHWHRAAQVRIAPYIIPASNFSKKGPARVGQYPGISPVGAYDMAGNVKEWIWNEAGGGLRFALGGAWSDAPYMFYDEDARSPFDRSATNGFRCVTYTSPPAAEIMGLVKRSFRDYSKEKPVDDEVFRAYKSLYSFEPSDLKPSVDSVNDSSPYWRLEKVSFQTAYSSQRMSAYLFLPKSTPPPYNAVVYFPGLEAIFSRSSSNGIRAEITGLDFLIRSGRAVLYPIYQGSYERSLPIPYPEALLQRRERSVQWSQDVHRSVDYLATRRDLVLDGLTYMGFSLGARISSIMISLEPRFKAAILLDGGLGFHAELPESDPINFVPRIQIPTLMVNGRSDFTFPVETAQLPLFRMLGTPEKDKRYVLVDAAHGVLFNRRNEVVREVLAWLERYAPTT
jgi:formylglycine-generating enzyme required for sulfatase activity/dienelactone hydrolase